MPADVIDCIASSTCKYIVTGKTCPKNPVEILVGSE